MRFISTIMLLAKESSLDKSIGGFILRTCNTICNWWWIVRVIYLSNTLLSDFKWNLVQSLQAIVSHIKYSRIFRYELKHLQPPTKLLRIYNTICVSIYYLSFCFRGFFSTILFNVGYRRNTAVLYGTGFRSIQQKRRYNVLGKTLSTV